MILLISNNRPQAARIGLVTIIVRKAPSENITTKWFQMKTMQGPFGKELLIRFTIQCMFSLYEGRLKST